MNARTLPANPFVAPAVPRGLFAFEYVIGDLDEPLVCHLEYEAETGDGWNEPRYEARVTLGAAYLRGLDVISLLSEDQVEHIEEQAAIDRRAEYEEAKAEAHFNRYED